MKTANGMFAAFLLLAFLAPGASAAPAQPAASPAAPAPASAPAAPGDEYWAEGFNFPGIDGGVYALAFGPDGSLYAGGSFTTAGGKPSSYIAQWTGAILRPAIWFPVVLMEQ